MRISRRAALLLLPLLAGCAAAAGPRGGATCAGEPAAGVPCFEDDGTVCRDAETGAPLFAVAAFEVETRAPRFNADGTVARDLRTGAPLYEERDGGAVVRVLVPLPR